MTYLLDTHTFVWSVLDSGRLSGAARKVITDVSNEIYVSTVSFWEIALKAGMKKYSFEGIDIIRFPDMAVGMGFTIIPLDHQEAISYGGLPRKSDHKDPFDRMIIWQAVTRKLTLVSKDVMFEQYKQDGLKLIW